MEVGAHTLDVKNDAMDALPEENPKNIMEHSDHFQEIYRCKGLTR